MRALTHIPSLSFPLSIGCWLLAICFISACSNSSDSNNDNGQQPVPPGTSLEVEQSIDWLSDGTRDIGYTVNAIPFRVLSDSTVSIDLLSAGVYTPAMDTQIYLAPDDGSIESLDLIDINDDGDALDVGENLVITPTIDQPLGLLDDGNGGFFFSSRSADTVYHAVDHNSDGDMLDLAEVLSYADAVFGDIDGPYDMAAHDSGGFLLADLFDGEVVLVRDANDDDDALDLGDVSLFADGFDSPVDIVAVSFFTADFDRDGDVDANDLTKWQGDYGGPGSDADGDGDSDGADFLAWQRQFTGTLSPPLSTANTVPEPLSTVLLFSLAAARFLYFSCIREIPSTSLKPPISMISRAL
jgi:hypothetical protein